jgi:hypothetical protein
MYPTKPKDGPSTVTEASESSLAHLLAQHGMRALSRRLNDALRPVGITSAQFCLLSLLVSRRTTDGERACRQNQDGPDARLRSSEPSGPP